MLFGSTLSMWLVWAADLVWPGNIGHGIVPVPDVADAGTRHLVDGHVFGFLGGVASARMRYRR
jgi:hypothetical protein